MSVSTQTLADSSPVHVQPRRFYYGWVMLPLATIGLIATAPGQTFSISVFNDTMRQALGLAHSQLTGAYMLGTFLAALHG